MIYFPDNLLVLQSSFHLKLPPEEPSKILKVNLLFSEFEELKVKYPLLRHIFENDQRLLQQRQQPMEISQEIAIASSVSIFNDADLNELNTKLTTERANSETW